MSTPQNQPFLPGKTDHSDRRDVEDIYSAVLDLWNKERTSEVLCEIPRDLEDRIRVYLSQARRQLRISDRRSIGSAVKGAEVKVIHELLGSIFSIRMRKILFTTILEKRANNLMAFEKHTFSNISRFLAEHKERVRNIAYDMRIYSEPGRERQRLLVRFSQDLPRIVGEDLKSYGPFKENDLATLPMGNIRSLTRKRLVKRIYVP